MIRQLMHRLGIHPWGPWKKRYYHGLPDGEYRRCRICGRFGFRRRETW
jgi:hypothetical protein